MDSAEQARRAGIRTRNAGLAHHARRHHFDNETHVPFLCECDDESCQDFVLLSLPEFRALTTQFHFVVTPWHSIDGAEWLMVTTRYALYRLASPSLARA